MSATLALIRNRTALGKLFPKRPLQAALLLVLMIAASFGNFSRAHGAPGDLDSSFGTGGKVTTSIGGGEDKGKSVVVQADGKIVVAGVSYDGTNYNFALVRYNINGSLDSSFGTGGKVITGGGGGCDVASVAVQGNGKIVVAGCSFGGATVDFALVRYNVNGSLDASFGSSGRVFTDFGNSHDFALAWGCRAMARS